MFRDFSIPNNLSSKLGGKEPNIMTKPVNHDKMNIVRLCTLILLIRLVKIF